MHYHLEIVLPPTDHLDKDLASILAPFDENGENNACTFWDWYVIGGRWGGVKLLAGDVCRLGDVANVTAHRVIIAGPAHEGVVSALFMIEQECWNGVTHVKTVWDGNLQSALAMWGEALVPYGDEWRKKCTPNEDWLVVTVDYHS